MRKILLIIGLLHSVAIFAQKESMAEIKRISSKELKFDDLKNTTDILSFRFWNKGQVIDIRILSDSTKVGTIINFITELPFKTIDESKEYTEDNLYSYYQKINLTNLEVKKALEIIEISKICDLPSDNLIKDWKLVLDGEWFSIEQKINNNYLEKIYGNPKSQEDLNEAKEFLSFYSDLEKTLKLNKVFSNFFFKLKIGCYKKNGEFEIICKQKKKV